MPEPYSPIHSARRKEVSDAVLKEASVVTPGMRTAQEEYVRQELELWDFINACNAELRRVRREQESEL